MFFWRIFITGPPQISKWNVFWGDKLWCVLYNILLLFCPSHTIISLWNLAKTYGRVIQENMKTYKIFSCKWCSRHIGAILDTDSALPCPALHSVFWVMHQLPCIVHQINYANHSFPNHVLTCLIQRLVEVDGYGVVK